MKALSIAALLALITTSTFTAAPADAQNWRNNNGYNNGYGWNNNYNGGAYNNNGWHRRPNYNSQFGNVNSRQNFIGNRIQQGIQSGRLSQREAAKIQSRYNKIADLENRLRSSGNGLSFNERARLNNDLSRLTAELNRDMRDRNGSSWW